MPGGVGVQASCCFRYPSARTHSQKFKLRACQFDRSLTLGWLGDGTKRVLFVQSGAVLAAPARQPTVEVTSPGPY